MQLYVFDYIFNYTKSEMKVCVGPNLPSNRINLN